MSAKPDPMIVEAPWDEVQVALLEAWQRSVWVNTLTCGPCRDSDCGCDERLQPTRDGLTHHCGYTQTWVPRICLVLDSITTLKRRR